MKTSCKKLHPERIKYSRRGTEYCDNCPTELGELDKELRKIDMLKKGFPLCYGKEHCNSCKKDYEKRFEEVANHERLAVGSKKLDKKYGN